MIKEYKINKELIFKYKLRNIFRVVKVISLIFLIFFLIQIFSNQNDLEPLSLTVLLVIGIVVLAGLLALAKKETTFESYTIRLEENRIIREGKLYQSDLINTSFDFSQIGKLKKVTNGYLLYKKGCYRLFKYHPYKMIGIYESDVIWIPFILADYDELIEFLKQVTDI